MTAVGGTQLLDWYNFTRNYSGVTSILGVYSTDSLNEEFRFSTMQNKT